MLRIDIITIFPELFAPFLRAGVLGIALQRGLLRLQAHDLRRFTHDKHRSVDGLPYGGGPGMVMKPEPLVEAVEALAGPKGAARAARGVCVALLSARGARFTQQKAQAWAQAAHLVLLCGRYEGVDQRAVELAVDCEISIGDYVVSGGEAPAMVVAEAVSRLVPGVLGNPQSAREDSFQPGACPLEAPQFTRPAAYRNLDVPEVLRSGDHARIAEWRRRQALSQAQTQRPDLLAAPTSRGK